MSVLDSYLMRMAQSLILDPNYVNKNGWPMEMNRNLRQLCRIC